jgi:uncharacterized protein involved in oxidation of intracellular sulfur
MSSTLIILNDAPYGSERTYNGLRLATAIAKRGGEAVRVFLIGDAASAAKAGQKVPQGFYNVGVMLRTLAKLGGEVGVCGSCMDARGIAEGDLEEGCHRSSMDELTTWTVSSTRTVAF